MKEPIFNIGDRVYHNTPEGSAGVVVDISYTYSSRRHRYYISIGFSDGEWCYEEELSEEKIIV